MPNNTPPMAVVTITARKSLARMFLLTWVELVTPQLSINQCHRRCVNDFHRRYRHLVEYLLRADIADW
jgi:hypothetical protein